MCSIDLYPAKDTVTVNITPRIASSSNGLTSVSMFTKQPVYLEYISGPGSSTSPFTPSRIVVDQLIDKTTDQYVFLKKENSTGIYIGWIQLRVVESGKVVLKAYRPMVKKEDLTL